MSEQITRDSFQSERLYLFWWFVCERQKIWHKRFVEKTKPPWSEDPIMQKERFTNVYRELDPGTQYAIKNILEIDALKADKIFNIMIYRLIGKFETHAAVGFQRLSNFDGKIFAKKLKTIREKGIPIFTSAYTVSGYSKMGSKDKVENVARIFDKLHRNFHNFYRQIENCKSAEEVYNLICSQTGFGNFLSYQILVDLIYPLKFSKPLLPFSHDEWASAGPGAKNGIKLLTKGTVDSELEIMEWLRDNQESEFKRLGLNFPYLKDENGKEIKISLANIQNCLCEFYKYFKIKNNLGRGKRKFNPTTPNIFYA